MRYISRIRCFNLVFVYEISPKYRIFGHRLSEVNRLEMKNFGTQLHLVLIPL